MLAPALVLSAASADDGEPPSKEAIAEKLMGVEAEDIVESPLDGVYQVNVGSEVAYVTADGRFLIQGDVYDLDTRENVTEASRAQARVDLLEDVDAEEAIVFAPEDGETRHRITVFTDIDCGYCRQFHREIDAVNDAGIAVRYLFYPRTGRDTDSWHKAEGVWCADDRNDALTRAKLGGSVPENDCGETPVGEHFELGNRVGVRGTPAMFAGNGELLGGYLPPDALVERLDEIAERESQ